MSKRWAGDDSLINEDLAPVPEEKRTWSRWNIAALSMGRDGGLHPDIYDGQRLDRLGDDVVAGAPDGISREPDCAHPNDTQRSSRNALRHPFPCAAPGKFWPARGEHRSASPGGGCLRLVRHSDMDRRGGDLVDFGDADWFLNGR